MKNYQTAFIASNNYFCKKNFDFGVGVIGSFNEETTKTDSKRLVQFDTDNCWYEINIPSRDTFLLLDSLIENNSEIVKNNLFQIKALSMLFFDEGKEFFQKAELYVNSKPQEERESCIKQELNNFYLKKQEELLQLKTVSSLIQFITNKSRPKDVNITSSFLSHFGITGVIYFENKEEHFLLFDAKNNILIKKANFTKL